jgi:hypothetical protein
MPSVSFLKLFFTLSLFASMPCLAAEKSPIKADLEFELNATTPLRITFCKNEVISYNRSMQRIEFYSLGDKQMRTFTNVTLKNEERVTALSCYNDKPLISIYDFKSKKQRIFGADLKLPVQEQVLDIKCLKKRCVFLFAKNVFEVNELKHWKQISVTPTHRAEPAQDKTDLNPFFRWQDKLTITEGLQTRLFFTNDGRLGLVDPFAASIVLYKETKSSKIGQWGVWGGKLLAPKAVTVSPTGVLLIMDAGVKAIFAFTELGEYWGSLQINGQLPHLDYPTDILAQGSLLVVADLRANKILGYRLAPFLPTQASSGLAFRNNYFRNEDVLKDRQTGKCMVCHDGTIRDDWDHFLPLKGQNHPGKQDEVSCSSCHNPHHGAVPVSGAKIQKGKIQSAPPF